MAAASEAPGHETLHCKAFFGPWKTSQSRQARPRVPSGARRPRALAHLLSAARQGPAPAGPAPPAYFCPAGRRARPGLPAQSGRRVAAGEMGPQERRATHLLLLALCAGQLLPPRPIGAESPRATPRIVAAPRGERRFRFDSAEEHLVLFHEEGASSVFVGAENKLYYFDFGTSTNHTEPFATDGSSSSHCREEDAKNYLTLLQKYDDKLLICGTNACSPTCWYWVDGKKEPGINAQSLAPFGLDQNNLVLIDGKDIYSTIKKHQFNGRIPRFRRIQGSAELYTSDTVMHNPHFVKAAVVEQDQSHNSKIYYFFREDNPDWSRNVVAPKRISRVAQLCKGDKGGSGSLSGAKWTTFLKATLLCVVPGSDRHFNQLQDVFILESAVWSETKVYGLFSNEWEYSAVCVYSVGEINQVFQTSPLKGYTDPLPAVRPGQCLDGERLTPQETFKVADSHPEVLHRVKQEAQFYSKHRYQQVLVHQVRAADGGTYGVLYLSTDKGTIHKVVALPTDAINVLEIQPFRPSAVILSMTLDTARNELFVASAREVVQLPMAMCGAYKDTCESCVLARDPYCGWTGGTCASVYDRDQQGNGTFLQALSQDVRPDICTSSHHNKARGNSTEPQRKDVTVAPQSRYYLNCSTESHHANYTWYHDGRSVAHCGPGHRHCIHFIGSMSDGFYGTYSCVSQEHWFNQTLVTERLLRPPETNGFRGGAPAPGDWATTRSLSFWLGLLHMVAVFLILQ
ncbi:semaphorin-7A [Elgaria multicarinata webbii]|uniref:semaphorin-7A n=1 Tax=Elgaria multicarinata webbii TaxID=159646 RepID=UPI002FCD19FB